MRQGLMKWATSDFQMRADFSGQESDNEIHVAGVNKVN